MRQQQQEGSGKKEPYMATDLRMKMSKKKEEITNAELKTLGRAAGIFSTILGASILAGMLLFVVVAVVTYWPLLLLLVYMLFG